MALEDLYLIVWSFLLELVLWPYQILVGDALTNLKKPFWLPRETGVVMITGGADSVGKVTAIELAKQSYHLILTTSTEEQARSLVTCIKDETGNPDVEAHAVDFASLDSVREFARAIMQRGVAINILINNMGGVCEPQSVTEDGLNATFQVNYAAPFLLTHLLLESLRRASPPARIINVSSFLHLFGQARLDDLLNKARYPSLLAYANTKLQMLLFTKELQRKLEQWGRGDIVVVASHARLLDTEVTTSSPFVQQLAAFFERSSTWAARTNLYLALAPQKELIPGKYYGNCRPMPESRFASNPRLSRRLWVETEKILRATQE